MSVRGCVGVILAIALLCVLAGCGVPADPAPRDIPAEDVPFGLLDTTTTTTSRPTSRARVTVFLVKADRLAPVGRGLPAPASPVSVLAVVPAGPTPAEGGGQLAQRGNHRRHGGAGVRWDRHGDARPGLHRRPVREQILSLAQLVYTVTALGGVRGVQFTFEGRLAEVPTAQGSLKLGVVTRADFAAIAPTP